MTNVSFPYGREYISYDFKDEDFHGTLVSKLHSYKPEKSAKDLVLDAMANPIGSKRLCELAKDKNKIVIIASDHTRPVPSKIIIPPMLEEIRSVNPNADITFLIATGCHRDTKREELVDKFGEEIVNNEKIVVHDCTDTNNLCKVGILPSGGELYINRLAYEADLLISEGFIEPHFFAGFSGGRKSVLPGVAARESVLANHCSEFIAHPLARTGILKNNPIHEDMLWAAKETKLAYIVNVVINEKKEAIYAVAGDVEKAHLAGCEFLSSQCQAKPIMSDIVISTNGGYPLDQNIYQAVKGMTAAEATVKEGGVIIMMAKSNDGHGGEGFFRQLADEPDIDITMKTFLDRGRNETVPDQWQTQIFLRILKRASVVYISDAPDDMVRDMHMTPAKDIGEALKIAKEILNNDKPSVVAIPDGVAVMVVD